jgi:hypothetical protein
VNKEDGTGFTALMRGYTEFFLKKTKANKLKSLNNLKHQDKDT